MKEPAPTQYLSARPDNVSYNCSGNARVEFVQTKLEDEKISLKPEFQR